jgi:hypothetical protein
MPPDLQTHLLLALAPAPPDPLAAILSLDWLLAAELLSGHEPVDERARRSVAERITALEPYLHRPDLAPDALVALSEVASDDQRRRRST